MSHGGPGLGPRALFLLLAACSSATQQVVETRDLDEAGGAPRIDEVLDLGGGDVPSVGEVRPSGRGDGVAVVGEALWIRGSAFGRQPTVLVAGRPAAVLSRTGDGGILVRVPVGAPAGPQPVVVSHARGRAEARVRVRRLAALFGARSGRIAWVEIGADGPAVLGTSGAGVKFLRLSADGRAAYVAGENGPLTVMEVPAPKLPAVVGTVDLAPPAPVVALLAASAAHLLVVVRQSDLVLLDTSSPLRPVKLAIHPLPERVRAGGLVRAELTPDGRHLAFALGEHNSVVLADVAQLGSKEAVVAELPLAPETRAPVLTDLAFAHDGRTLWVVAGDTAASHPLGPQITRVFAVRVMQAGGHLSLQAARAVPVDVAADPVRLATGRSLPLASGATVRLPPEKATVYLAASVRGAERSAVFAIGAEDAASELLVAQGKNRVGGVDVTPEGRWLLAAALDSDGGLRVLSAPADGRPGDVRSLPLGEGGERPEVRVQP